MRSVAPSAPASSASTVPMSCDQSGEHPHHSLKRVVIRVSVARQACAGVALGASQPPRPVRAGGAPPSRTGATKIRASSISSASAKAAARVAPPSRKRLVMLAAAELVEGAGRCPPATRISAPASRSASSRGVGLGAGDDEDRRLVEGLEQLGVERQAGLASRRRRGAGWRAAVDVAGGEQRVVGEDGADADGDRVGFGAPAVDEVAALLAGDPGGVARRGRGAAVERHRQLQRHQRQAGAGVLAEGLVEEARGRRLLARRRSRPRRPPSRRIPGPRPAAFSLGIVGGDHDARDARPRGSPRRRAAGAPGARRARASRTSSPRPGPRPALAAIRQRRPLRVQPTQLGVKPLADRPRRRGRSPRRPADSG